MPDFDRVRALVVGGDGLIGSAVVHLLRARGVSVIATTRRRGPSSWFLDLSDRTGFHRLPAAEIVFLCAAETSIARCEADPVGTHAVNVTQLGVLAAQCHASGAFLVLPSSTAVFDGGQAHRRADEPVSPTTEYGRQKAAIEAQVLGLQRSAAVRFSKVLDLWPSLFSRWRTTLVDHRPVHAFADMVLAPVTALMAAEALVSVAAARGEGVFQLSADRDLTYLSVAQRLATRLRVTPQLVIASTAAAAGIPRAAVPAHTTLDVTRLTREAGIRAPDAWQVIEAVTPLDEAARTTTA